MSLACPIEALPHHATVDDRRFGPPPPLVLQAGRWRIQLAASRDGERRTGRRLAGLELVWVSRFEADLRIMAGHVAPDVHEYLTAEVEVLAGLVDTLDEQVHVAMHGDPWHENVLLEPDRVWLLDWEKLCVGDPVIDGATLLMDACGSRVEDWPLSARYDVARRALMLDAAVDAAADWVQNSDPAIRDGSTRHTWTAWTPTTGPTPPGSQDLILDSNDG